MKILHLFSGGLDSTVLLYDMLSIGHEVRCLLFNYGQRHAAELRCARATCKKLNVEYDEVELSRIRNLFLRCALTDGASESVVVPNRNAIFANIAAAMAESLGFEKVSLAVTAEDYEVFQDCRNEWRLRLNETLQSAGLGVRVIAPFIYHTKRDVVKLGRRLGVPFDETMSCYRGTNCGRCIACKTRKKALCGK